MTDTMEKEIQTDEPVSDASFEAELEAANAGFADLYDKMVSGNEETGDGDAPSAEPEPSDTNTAGDDAPSVPDAAEPADTANDGANGDQPDEWPAELLERAALYGLSGDDLTGFSSPDEVDRALALLGSRMLRGVPEDEPEQEPVQEEQQQPAPEPQNRQKPTVEGSRLANWTDETRNEFDPEIIELYEGFDSDIQQLKAQMSEMQSIKTSLQQQESAAALRAFDQAVDGLDGSLSEIYGKSETLTDKQAGQRKELMKKAWFSWGADGLSNPRAIKEVASILNAETVKKDMLRDVQSAAKKNQGKRLIRSGQSSTAKVPEDDFDEYGVPQYLNRLYDEMDAKQ